MIEQLRDRLNIVNEDYLTSYINLISLHTGSAKGKGLEEHHILPKCIWPEYIKTKQNKVYLTPAEHYTAHKLLALATKNQSLCYSFNMMKQTRKENRLITDEEYNQFKVEFGDIIRANLKRHGQFNHSAEQRSIWTNERWSDPKQREAQSDMMKLRNPMTNKINREKISASKKGKPAPWVQSNNPMHDPKIVAKFSGINSSRCTHYMVHKDTKINLNLTDFLLTIREQFGVGKDLGRRIFHWCRDGKPESQIDEVVVKKTNRHMFDQIVNTFYIQEKQK